MRSLSAFILGLLAGGFFGALGGEAAKTLVRRVTKTTKPPFSYQTRENAQWALIRAEDVFRQAIDEGGSLIYPWTVRGETVLVENIRDGLRSAIAAIPNEEFQTLLNVVDSEIFEVWHSRHVSVPMVY